MMFFHDAGTITFLQHRSYSANGFEKEIHAYRKIRAIEKPYSALGNQFLHLGEVLVPTGSPYNHGNAGLKTTNDVRDHRVGSSEVDHHLGFAAKLGCKSTAIRIIGAAHRANFVAAFFGNLGNQGPGFTATQHQYFHANTSGSTSEKKV